MSERENWYIITGGPSTGKTTLLKALAKHGYATVEEAARAVIDDARAKGQDVTDLREDEKDFQDQVVLWREKEEAKTDPDVITFLDRGRQDSLAYYRYYKFPIAESIIEHIEKARYRKVFVMEPLGIFKPDYARTENRDFNDFITDLLVDAYKEYGMETILVPPVSVEERVKIVLKATGLK